MRGAATGRSGPITVSFVPGPCPSALAFAIGKKVGNAVVRNRLRRRLKELLRQRLDLRCGTYLVRARPEAAALAFEELFADLQRATNRFASSTPPAGARSTNQDR